MGKQRVTAMVCDNPDCEQMFIVDDEGIALGYYFGKGMWHGGAGGGPLPAIYVHKLDCLVPAVQAAMQR